MSQTVSIPVANDVPPTLVFPGRCVACGGPREAESRLDITRLVERRRGRQVALTFRYQVPHCARCARATKTVFLAGLIPFLLGFAAAGIVAFLYVAVWASPLDEPVQRTTPSLVLGSGAGLAAGLIGGFIAEVLARLMLWPFFGQSLLAAPLLVRQLLEDSDYVAGLRARLNRERTALTLTFRRDTVAQEFAALNARVLAGSP